MIAQNLPWRGNRQVSAELYDRGLAVFPDGTTRITVERDPTPRYIKAGKGAYLEDVDGNRLLDLNNNFTTLIHGHAFGPVTEAVSSQLARGSCFANPTEHEINLAELLIDRIPSIERVRFVNSGTEAVMFAIKAARAFTGRPGVARIEGAFHGAYDWAEIGQAGTPANWGAPEDPAPVPLYAGVPSSVADDVLVLRFNDVEGLQRLEDAAERLSCVLIDPMPSRAGLIAAVPDFLKALTAMARRNDILLVADEVLNLRQGYHGASARYGLKPDLVAMGKIIGGGFPIGAIGGREDVMRVFGTQHGKARLPQGGTFSANAVSMLAGYVAMQALTEDEFDRLDQLGEKIRTGLIEAIKRHGAAFAVTGAASLFRIHPKQKPPREFRDAFCTPDEAVRSTELQRHFLAHGILLPGGAAASLSTAMGMAEATMIVDCFDDFLSQANQH
ncbi:MULTISPECIES: aspartate aminotransferase family protein [unclassified Mesorhizobium]|uniref:aspartate aminotransferase family protein n=1 Tax=unclassified Mesorhizobium TaxID=325217 RepID=UPI00112798E4|nr:MULTISPECIES: aspartate aminotransferase family protein [unclassified Mesorhizobium]MBZ9739788.1 aspartate aminotransferase family protein [Mesorhizobium sp. CO1-1-4]MBZ9804948.1 aspartate aminotransferase family protein [Mesorhizobium sp. ES1-6]TPL88693.1 aspartate aminotransferase family protein [Mesorhizobium sp. B2-3-12]